MAFVRNKNHKDCWDEEERDREGHNTDVLVKSNYRVDILDKGKSEPC